MINRLKKHTSTSAPPLLRIAGPNVLAAKPKIIVASIPTNNSCSNTSHSFDSIIPKRHGSGKSARTGRGKFTKSRRSLFSSKIVGIFGPKRRLRNSSNDPFCFGSNSFASASLSSTISGNGGAARINNIRFD
ncbi:hypothetical protein DERP_003053 [Dermatophagoides pteronyssinus]|uniref:Uncharacterized protein n=1 Tax=Dermatophagoides pteronyssinus TaxID=6956 RepID=A0ABQ8JIE2_DERPT|nr:hypothetical protein DERP_003053 [Dermatophagoides pteronyssinus]